MLDGSSGILSVHKSRTQLVVRDQRREAEEVYEVWERFDLPLLILRTDERGHEPGHAERL